MYTYIQLFQKQTNANANPYRIITVNHERGHFNINHGSKRHDIEGLSEYIQKCKANGWKEVKRVVYDNNGKVIEGRIV